tara:strand:- start:677 stop:823 length:147 start_codon:yes stop_codon:yes gene_type:complete
MTEKNKIKALEKIISTDEHNLLIDGENIILYTLKKYYYKLKVKFNLYY